MVASKSVAELEVYQGQFGEFTIDRSDRLEVIIYRAGLTVAALCFILGTAGLLLLGTTPWVMSFLTILFFVFSFSLAPSLVTIHIYLAPLKRLLQFFWFIGFFASIILVSVIQEPLAVYVYSHPLTLLGIGFTFAALTGIYFKEGICFHRLETGLLTFLVPLLLLGHMLGLLSVTIEKVLLVSWAILFTVFVIRKLTQAIPPDIGDKSVFTYLEQQSQSKI